MKIYNPNIKNINRIEFSVTNCCTSRCKHCSVGEIKGTDNISVEPAIEVIELLTKEYKVESVMTFGGEPLLFAETTCTIHKKATECGIPIRQIITNGCFTKDELRMQHVAKALNECGVNEILLSIDCFHEEFLPLTWVHSFAEKLVDNYRERLRLHPAWVVNETHDNPYNQRTRHCLKFFDDLQIDIDEGNNVYPSGNAVKYLNE
ncbi:MAG: radical SAM protein, partial [Bacillota bacterium]|nr:radical SAM protein [Bacillota bacterium]